LNGEATQWWYCGDLEAARLFAFGRSAMRKQPGNPRLAA
jgi:hypothetical protein